MLKNILAILIVIIIALLGGIYIGYYYHPIVSQEIRQIMPYNVPYDGLIPVNVSIDSPNVRLDNGCKRISFDVTSDQAMSIYNGINGRMNERPLTQDIMKDVMDNYGIEMLQAKIDRYGSEIYYATITLRKGNEVLVLDARPSDAISLALRRNVPLYFNKSLFDEKSVQVC